MAYRIATANGDWTAAATWGAVDATSLLDSQAASTTLTTSYVESSAFTPGAITIDGIAVKINTRLAGTGTMSVRLATGAVLVAGTEVTINVSDIVNQQTNNAGANGWIFFKFAAPVLLLAATNYTVSAKTSSAAQISLFRDATAGNWSRMLRTTTTGAPAAGDSMFVLGEWTAAATKTNRVVTMNETASTDYGGASTSLASLGIGVGGTLAYANSAATNYVLRLSGVLEVWAGGTFTIGTSSAPIPRGSTAVLEFDCAADGDFGFKLWGTAVFRAWGQSRTSNKNIVQCLLNTDEAIAQTVLGVDTDTGWLSGDTIAIASTTRATPTDAETATLSGDAAATTITISAGLAAAHGGSAATLVQAEVILLTRNVMVRSVSSTSMAYGQTNGSTGTAAGAVVDWGWVDLRYMGAISATNKEGALSCVTALATFTAEFCCFRDSEGYGIRQNTAVDGSSTWSLTDCVFYGAPGGGWVALIGASSTSTCTIGLTRCTAIGDGGTQNFVRISVANQPFEIVNCRVASQTGEAIFLDGGNGYGITSIIRGCTFHSLGTTSAGAIGLRGSFTGLTIEDCVIYRINCAGTGLGAITLTSSIYDDVNVIGCTFFGNAEAHIGFSSSANQLVRAIFRDCIFAGDSSSATLRGFDMGEGWFAIRIENCTFGVVTGIRVAHTTASFGGDSTMSGVVEMTLVNTVLSDATEIEAGWLTGYAGRSFIARQRGDGTTNTHSKQYLKFGTIAYEATTFRTTTPSEKLTPTIGANTTYRLRSSPKRIPVAAGDAVTVGCYVRKDATYNGDQPRLLMLANPAIGLDDDLTIKTMTGAADQWEQLTGIQTPVAEEDGVVECCVEVNGSAGNAYVDDWSASSA